MPPFSVYRSCSWRPIVTVSLHSGGYFTIFSRKTSEDVSERDLRRNIFIHRRLRLQTYAIEMPRPAKAEWTGLHSVSGWPIVFVEAVVWMRHRSAGGLPVLESSKKQLGTHERSERSKSWDIQSCQYQKPRHK